MKDVLNRAVISGCPGKLTAGGDETPTASIKGAAFQAHHAVVMLAKIPFQAGANLARSMEQDHAILGPHAGHEVFDKRAIQCLIRMGNWPLREIG